jgi:hypothetical protein
MHTLLDKSRAERNPHLDEGTVALIRSKFAKNYFGLPPYSMQQTASGLAYHCRAPREDSSEESTHTEILDVQENERPDVSSRRNIEDTANEKADTNYTAQRKVSSALLTMVNNPQMMKHFLNKGGFEAVLKLVKDGKFRLLYGCCYFRHILILTTTCVSFTAKDPEVLVNCCQCLIEVSSSPENTRLLVEKGIFQPICTLQDSHDESLKFMTSIILAKLSNSPGQEDLLLLNGMLSSIQFLLVRVHRTEGLCYLLIR